MLAVDYQTLVIWGGGSQKKGGIYLYQESVEESRAPDKDSNKGDGDSSRRGKDIYSQTLSTL